MELKFEGIDLSPSACRAAENHVRAELGGVALVEALIFEPDARFDVADFGQDGSDQAPYDEVYLSEDGNSTLPDSVDPPRESTLRVAFFLHFLNPSIPFRTSYGSVPLPAIAAMLGGWHASPRMVQLPKLWASNQWLERTRGCLRLRSTRMDDVDKVP